MTILVFTETYQVCILTIIDQARNHKNYFDAQLQCYY
jgi:hypothetical protein